MATYEEYRRFRSATRTDILFEDADGTLTPFFDHADDNPLVSDSELRSFLRGKASERTAPILTTDGEGIYYAAMLSGTGWMYIGPMLSEDLSEFRLRQYYRNHGIDREDVRKLQTRSMSVIRDITLLAAAMILGITYSEEDIDDSAEHRSDKTRSKDNRDFANYVTQVETENDDEYWRHSYYEETLLLQAVREGRTEDAIRMCITLDDDEGRIGATALSHFRTLAIIGITLCSRAAIEGGMTPDMAYNISGYYILRLEDAHDTESILRIRNRAVEELATRVATSRSSLGMSNYTARCKDYVRKHYREKIYIDDIADSLGITTTYLSKLFRQETGVTFQEFVNQVRVSRAAELLQYTDMSLSDIAIYVHFPSQSYFGRIFKRYRNITPKGYRDRYKVGEFTE